MTSLRRVSFVLFSTMLGVAACSQSDGGAPSPAVSVRGTGASVTQEVGAAGGNVTLEGATLVIPAGALASAIPVTITSTVEPAPGGYGNFSPVYRFEPAGTTFATPATLTLAYQGDAARAGFFFSRPNGAAGYDRLASTSGDGTLTAQVSHFSTGFVGEVREDAGDAGTSDPGPLTWAGPSPHFRSRAVRGGQPLDVNVTAANATIRCGFDLGTPDRRPEAQLYVTGDLAPGIRLHGMEFKDFDITQGSVDQRLEHDQGIRIEFEIESPDGETIDCEQDAAAGSVVFKAVPAVGGGLFGALVQASIPARGDCPAVELEASFASECNPGGIGSGSTGGGNTGGGG